MPGSSPHAWGTRFAGVGQFSQRRFIPTRVGNTSTGPAPRAHSPVHPHTRGEHAELQVKHLTDRGSSPHAWGTLPRGRARKRRGRFIPTRVGNTAPSVPCIWRCPVHPHTRGEHAMGGGGPMSAYGSSPHAWGTLELGPAADLEHRFIPTRVGNTSPASSPICRGTVHPHTRGEHDACFRERDRDIGSSPHAWGTRLCAVP